MESFTEVKAKMNDAMTSGASLQTGIRKFIREEVNAELWEGAAAKNVARLCSEFRDEAEGWIKAGKDDDEVQARRKTANNIINDVSRICRTTIHRSIVCVKRGPYEYEAVEPKAKTTGPSGSKPTVTIHPVPVPDTELTVLEMPSQEQVAAFVKSYPALATFLIVDNLGEKDAAKLIRDQIMSCRTGHKSFAINQVD